MSALDRLIGGYYNSLPVSGANPGGLTGGGHVQNFPAALADLAEVLETLQALGPMAFFSPETAAVLDTFDVTPSAGRIGAIDQMILRLKLAGVWDRLDLLYLPAAHDEQAGRINWKAPGTHTLTAVNSPTFSVDRGFTGDGATAYLDSGVLLAALTNYKQDDASMFGWELSAVASSSPLVGLAGTSGQAAFIYPSDGAGNLAGRTNSSGNFSVAVPSPTGFSAWSRPDAATEVIYKDGVGSTFARASAGTGLGTFALLRNLTAYSTRQISVAGVGASLTAAQQLALFRAVRTYLLSLGAFA